MASPDRLGDHPRYDRLAHMDLSSFYGLIAGTCFTLVGLWWTVLGKREDWKRDWKMRKLAGGTYLSFLIPGLMATFAQVAPTTPLLWRFTFAISALLGIASTLVLLRVDSGGHKGPFRSNRWIVVVLYAAITVFAVAPELAQPVGLTALQVASLLLIGLILIGHGLTWEFLMSPADDADAVQQ